MVNNNFEEKLQAVFRRVFNIGNVPGNISVGEIENWDSLTHIKLVMELESEFGKEIDPDDIPHLYSDFSNMLKYIKVKIT